VALCGCSAPNPAGATLRVIPDPIKLLVLAPKGEPPPPCCSQFVADFALHITANGLMSVEGLVARVTRKADGAVYTWSMQGRDIGFQSTRLVAGERYQWQLPVHLLATFDTPNPGRDFALRIETQLLLKTGNLQLTLEPKMVEG
jgi:hypothetical protein